jgi:hypothetical protein
MRRAWAMTCLLPSQKVSMKNYEKSRELITTWTILTRREDSTTLG